VGKDDEVEQRRGSAGRDSLDRRIGVPESNSILNRVLERLAPKWVLNSWSLRKPGQAVHHATRGAAALAVPPNAISYACPDDLEGDMATEPKIPLGYYVYTISVADVVRYIGKGKGLRLYCHMKEVRSRLNRDYRLENIGSLLQQNLTKAVLSGAKVIEEVLMDGLTDAAAYKLEYDKLREYVFAGNRDQLWNVIPGSIYTPQELQAFAERLQRNLNSRDRWIRYLSERTLAALIRGPATRGTAPLGIDAANTRRSG
jgi:hypothetical protein